MVPEQIYVHRGKNLLGISTGFLKNPALFTLDEGFVHGDFYRVTLPGYRLYIVTDPKILHHIMISNEAAYEKSKMYWKQLRTIIGRAMGSLEGEEWLFLRKMQGPFFTKSKIKTYLSDVCHITRKHLDYWKVEEGKQLEVVGLISKMNTEIVLKTVFGVDAEKNYEQIAINIRDGQKTISWRSKFPWRPITGWLNGMNKSAQRHLRFFDGYTEKSMQQAKSKPNFDANENLLNRLIAEPSIAQTDIRNEMIVHLGASTETAAVGEAWTLYFLAKNPKALAIIRHEIKELVGDRELTGDMAFQLPYTEQVIKESLRLYPPSYASLRDCIKSDEIKGQKIDVGDSFFISLFALHRHPKYWKQPNKFIPERFAPENAADIYPNTYHPYGVGKHHCIGRFFATPMLVLTIAEICRRFNFELLDSKEKEPMSLSTLKPKDGMKLFLSERL